MQSPKSNYVQHLESQPDWRHLDKSARDWIYLVNPEGPYKSTFLILTAIALGAALVGAGVGALAGGLLALSIASRSGFNWDLVAQGAMLGFAALFSAMFAYVWWRFGVKGISPNNTAPTLVHSMRSFFPSRQ